MLVINRNRNVVRLGNLEASEKSVARATNTGIPEMPRLSEQHCLITRAISSPPIRQYNQYNA
jgi:hypothetical protein